MTIVRRSLTFVIAVVLVTAAGTAFAESGTPEAISGSPTVDTGEQHCVYWTVPGLSSDNGGGSSAQAAWSDTGRKITPVRAGKEFCFTSEADLDAFMDSADVRYQEFLQSQPGFQEFVRQHPEQQGTTTSNGATGEVVAAASIWARLYEHAGYGGSSWIWYFPGPCGAYGYGTGWAVD
jgi:hypothetical protein